MRERVSTKTQVDLHNLKPHEKIYYGIKYKITNSEKHRLKLERQQAEKERIRTELVYNIISSILTSAYDVFENTDRNDVTIKVARKYEPLLTDVLRAREFDSFIVTHIRENPDYLLAFPDLPIFLHIEKKVI